MINNCGVRRVWVFLIMAEVPHSLLDVDLIFKLLYHNFNCVLVEVLQTIDVMASYIQRISGHKVIEL